MRVYIHDEKTNGLIAKACKALHVEVLTIQEVRARKFAPQTVERQPFFMDTVDLLIVEATRPTQDIHFILAQAIITRKPTLCVYGKNQAPRELLSFIKRDESAKILRTFSYVEEQLASVVQDFVKRYDPRFMAETQIPEIKFTLRLTKFINAYLEDEALKRGSTKADLIRDILDECARSASQVSKRKRTK